MELEKLEFKKSIDNANAFFKSMPSEDSHYKYKITKSALIKLEGNKPLVYLKFDQNNFQKGLNQLLKLTFYKSNRKLLGKNNYSIIAGGMSKHTNHSDFCNVGALSLKDVYLNDLIINCYSKVLADLFVQFLPQWDKIGNHWYNQTKIHEDYRMQKTIYTSAILNKNSAHYYHFDTANLLNTYSAMIILKNQVSGGYLVLPEYELAIEAANASVIFFYGRNILHGVSPIKYHDKNGFRYSIVYYTNEALKDCKSILEEHSKI